MEKDLGFTIGGNEINTGFYEKLLKNLAHKKMAEIWFLLSGTKDIAAAVLYKHKSTIYRAQIAFDQLYAEYSPGTITSTEILKRLFNTNYLEFDFLGYRGEDKNNLKIKWSTGGEKLLLFRLKFTHRSLYEWRQNKKSNEKDMEKATEHMIMKYLHVYKQSVPLFKE